MKETIKLCIALGLTCCIAGAILVYANRKTQEARDQAELVEKQAALSRVLGDFANQPLKDSKTFEDKDSFGKVTFYLAKNDANEITGIAGEGSPVSNKGFGGDMNVMVSLAPDGAVKYVIVTAHSETPGLGTNATDRKLTRSLWSLFGGSKQDTGGIPPNTYLDRYAKRTATDLAASSFTILGRPPQADENAVQGISGATISSRAVGDAVHQICTAFDQNRAALLN
jgi:electron transport complex protein RnfG